MPARAGLLVVAAIAVAAPAAGAASKCRSTARCAGKGAKPAKLKNPKPNGSKSATGWHNGTYDGGPGDPIIAPLPD